MIGFPCPQLFGMTHKILIQGILSRNQNQRGILPATSHPAAPLPHIDSEMFYTIL